MTKSPEPFSRRSPCPVSCALDILGDKWTLLVVRDLLLGRRRFKEFAASPEKIPTNILTDRLNRLVDRGVVERSVLEESPGREGYSLTEKGHALSHVVKALMRWGLEWEPNTVTGIKHSRNESRLSRPSKTGGSRVI